MLKHDEWLNRKIPSVYVFYNTIRIRHFLSLVNKLQTTIINAETHKQKIN